MLRDVRVALPGSVYLGEMGPQLSVVPLEFYQLGSLIRKAVREAPHDRLQLINRCQWPHRVEGLDLKG